jgi:hypothetical protein
LPRLLARFERYPGFAIETALHGLMSSFPRPVSTQAQGAIHNTFEIRHVDKRE